jgi:hypothetical protein
MKTNFFLLAFFLAGITLHSGCEEDLFDMFGDPRDRITGEWKVEEDSEIFKKKDTNRFYSVYITKDPVDSTIIYIENFYELQGKVKANMNGYTLSIPDQTVDGFTIQDGSGSIAINYKSMTLYYYVSFTGERDVVRADYTRPSN